ncbi:IPT/TIG domain-containing protein [Nocardioides pelophilus]|uniref:IPT/TIG domain-containing protein n=1 Tax=Nocardioides pelophilus TaxID=2172019 RepID=UPI0015FF4DAE|nr:IPT/TIG domain-containing protein [Nocardioides pelophilus]
MPPLLLRTRRPLLGLALVAALASTPMSGTGAQAAGTYDVVATVPVGGGPFSVAVDPSTHTAYVGNLDDSSVSVIDGTTRSVTATVPVGSGLYGVAVDPTTHTAYVTGHNDNTVSVIDGTTNAVTATVPVGSGPYGVAVDPTTHTVYVANTYENTVSVIDGTTNVVTATVPVGSSPYGVAVDPTTHTAYVTSYNNGSVSVIDGTTNAVTATVPVEISPFAIAVDPSTHTAYVTNISSSSVSVIDGTSNSVTATIPVPNGPYGVAVDPSTHTAYVTSATNHVVSVIDGTSNSVTATVPVGQSPYGLATDRSTHTTYVASYSSSSVSMIAAPFSGDTTVDSIAALQAAGSTCTGTVDYPTTITLAAEIVAPGAEVSIGCHAVLDLAGHDLTVRNALIAADQALTIDDTAGGGTMTADASGSPGIAGIRNTGSTVTIKGGAVSARGGVDAAGIGGDLSGAGGTTVIDGGTVIATGPSSAVGAGEGATGFGTLAVDGGVLRLPSGFLRVPDSVLGAEITIGPDGVIDGSAGPDPTYATIVGQGQIEDGGRILLPTPHVTGGDVTVRDRHYAVDFDTRGGSTAPDPVTVFADTFANGDRLFPSDPTKAGSVFTGWNSAADGTGDPITGTSTLPGASADGGPVQVSAHAQWQSAPAITGVAPASGPLAGGTEVVITGTGFTGATRVDFGSTGQATSFTVDSDTQITAVSPPSAVSVTRNILVRGPAGVSPAVVADRFTYGVAPTVTGIAPSSGPLAGGTEVVITGTGFAGTTRVSFGSTGQATSFTVDSDTQITAVSPRSTTNVTRNIVVRNLVGTSPTVVAGRFTYGVAPTVTGIAPSSGPLAGGTEVVITGTGFAGATRVTFGGIGTVTFVVDSDSQVTAVSPATTGRMTRHVRVRTPLGTSDVVLADLFTWR